MQLRLYKKIPCTKTAGIGKRYALWVQGCPIRCLGCIAKDTWDFAAGDAFDINELIEDIKKAKSLYELEGVTFLGGEPFAQATALNRIAKQVKKWNLTLITFTGYSYEDILAANKEEWQELLMLSDLLIDGAFKKEEYDLSRPWVASTNQRYIFLSPVYKHLADDISSIKNKIEIRLQPNGTILINGMADFEGIKKALA